MAGGEFRFGTASIYMAQRANIQPNRTSQMRVTTWTRFRRPQRHFLSTSAAFIVSARGKLGLSVRHCSSGGHDCRGACAVASWLREAPGVLLPRNCPCGRRPCVCVCIREILDEKVVRQPLDRASDLILL